MGELLASIRRIIAEDGASAKDSGESTQEPAGPAASTAAPVEAPVEAPAHPAMTPAAQSWADQAAPGRPAAAPTDEDALLLTEMVAEDGTVVSLAGGGSEEPTSELQSPMRISYAVFCLKKKNTTTHIE